MDNIDDPWNFHTCKLCNYRTRFLHRILSHVRQHRTRAETHRFICDLHSPEEHKCEKCQFQSHLNVLLTKHFNTVHKAKETEHYLNSELRNCESCDFQTYSSLVLLGHKCGNGGTTENHVLQGSETGNVQRENFQSYKRRHSPNNKSCTISSQSTRKVVDGNEVTTNNLKHRRILRNSNQPEVSNIQHIQHPSNKNKIFTVSSHNSSNNVDSDDMATDNMKPKRILRSSKKPRLSGIQDIIQHPSNKKTYTISSQSIPNDIDSEDKTIDIVKPKRILRSSKKFKLSSNQQAHHPTIKTIYTISSQSISKDIDSDDKTIDNNMKPKRILRSSKKPKLSTNQHIQHPTKKKTSTISSQNSPNDVDSEAITLDNMKHKLISKKSKLSNIQQTQLEKLKSFECDLCPYKSVKKNYLRRHILRIHSPSKNDNNRFKCKDCSFKYKRERSLRRHVLSKHTQLKPFKCDHCSYTSVRKDTLKEHIYRRHTPSEQINWYICEHCSFKAKVKYALDVHVLLKHTQFAKPEMLKRLKKCNQCSYKTIYKSILERHTLRKHTALTCFT